MALGARPRTVLALVMGQGLAIAVGGGAAGVIAALIAARPLRNFLHGISPDDPVVLGLSALAAMFLGAAASVPPAWRAIRIDPARTLRDQ
jgi:ABC-type lipoprotein release transport system permease subunit